MLKDFAWKAFENTGNIDAYVFFREIEEHHRIAAEKQSEEDGVSVNKAGQNVI